MSEPTEKDRERARKWLLDDCREITDEHAITLSDVVEVESASLSAEFAAVREEAQAERGALGDPELEARHEYRVEEFKRAEARIRELEAEVERLKQVETQDLAAAWKRAEKAEADLAASRAEVERQKHEITVANASSAINLNALKASKYDLAALQQKVIEENHFILTLTGTPRGDYTLQQEIRAQLEEAQANLAALKEAGLELVAEYDRFCSENPVCFVARDVERLRALLAAEPRKEK